MDQRISSKAIQLIKRALIPLIQSGCRIDQVKLVVAAEADIAKHRMIQMDIGKLRVQASRLVPMGYAYLIEDHCKGFAWVIRKNMVDQAS